MILTDWFFLLNSIQSETPFDGAYGNLKRLFDKAAKMYHQVKKQDMKKLSPSRQRCVSLLLDGDDSSKTFKLENDKHIIVGYSRGKQPFSASFPK